MSIIYLPLLGAKLTLCLLLIPTTRIKIHIIYQMDEICAARILTNNFPYPSPLKAQAMQAQLRCV